MNIDVQSEKNELEEFKDLTGKVTVAMADVLATLHQKNIEYLGTIEQLQEECRRLEEEKKDYEKKFVETLQADMGSLSQFQQGKFAEMVNVLETWTKNQQEQLNTMQTAQEEKYKLHCDQMNEAWNENVQPLKTLHGWLFEQKRTLILEFQELEKQQKEYKKNKDMLNQGWEQLHKEKNEFEMEKMNLPNIKSLQKQLSEIKGTNETLLSQKNGLRQQIVEYESTCKDFQNQIDTLTSDCEKYKEQYETMSRDAEKFLIELNQYKEKYGQLEDRIGVDRYGE